MKHLPFLALALTACTSSGSPPDDDFADVEGIYQVDSYVRNDNACTPDGASVLGDEHFAIARTEHVFGFAYLQLTSCASPADCRARLAAADAGQPVSGEFSFFVDHGGDGSFTGSGASTGFSGFEDGLCHAPEATDTSLTLDRDALRIEMSIRVGDDYPEIAGGGCSTDAGRAAAEDAPCSQLEVLTAHLVEAL